MKTRLLFGVLAVLTLGSAPGAFAVGEGSERQAQQEAVDSRDPVKAAMMEQEALASEQMELHRLYAQQAQEEAEVYYRQGLQEHMQAWESEQHKKRKHLEQFRLLKLLELLNLSDEQETEFIGSFTRLRRQMRDLEERRSEILERLGGGVDRGDIPEDEINQLVDDLLRTDEDKRRLRDEFLQDSRRYLSAEQVARFIIFQERFEYELLERVKSFQDRARSRGWPGRRMDRP